MKKIINGLRYDTEKAIKVGFASRGYINEFPRWEATLYRTPRSGRFFLAGEGGPMSRFAQSEGVNSWGSGSGIIPMSRAEALEWAEQHLSPEEIEKHFGDDIQDA
jgi:hypothetical protein